MNSPEVALEQNWQIVNQRCLMAAIDRLRPALQRYAVSQGQMVSTTADGSSSSSDIQSSPAIDRLCQTFQLSSFERDILLFCAGVELDEAFRVLCAQAQPNLKHGAPTFNLLGAVLPNCYWDAFTPDAPLRRWQLIDIEIESILMTAPLRVSERILHYLMGLSQLDTRLSKLLKPIDHPSFLVASHQLLVQEIVTSWQSSKDWQSLPIVQLCGSEPASQRSIAASACTQLGFKLYVLSSNAIPTDLPALHDLTHLWQQEALLSQSALLFDWRDASTPELNRAIASLIEAITTPFIVISRDRHAFNHRSVITLDVEMPTATEQVAFWQSALGDRATDLNGCVELLVSQFNLSPTAIQAASLQVTDCSPTLLPDRLWQICRIQARPQLDDLAQRIDAGEDWEDLVLPEPQKQILQEISAHVRQRSKVYDQWGFAGKGRRGLGISALFSGLSGTGKTMASGVLARELRLDLYRIDLSSVVSKYIGETEKNLRRVFDAAEAGGVILLFDEADALFGKRSDVKDSHDRYANMEVSYLLQRMESYRGLAILTTNLKDAIDPAFMRRIRFMVRFPFPEYGDRTRIWQRIFPSNTPILGLNFKKLAKLNIAGGNIRNIALNAAFLAADQGQPVMMGHVLKAAQGEYLKLERSLTDAEIRGWIQDEIESTSELGV